MKPHIKVIQRNGQYFAFTNDYCNRWVRWERILETPTIFNFPIKSPN